jgi:hypothetical protein
MWNVSGDGIGAIAGSSPKVQKGTHNLKIALEGQEIDAEVLIWAYLFTPGSENACRNGSVTIENLEKGDKRNNGCYEIDHLCRMA